MQNHNLTKGYSIVFVSLFLMLALAASGFAQGKPAPAQAAAAQMQPYSMTVMQVKPGMALEWESFLKQTAIPLMKKGGVKGMGVSRTNTLGVDGTYYFMMPVANLAEFDGVPPMYKAMGWDTISLSLSAMQRCVSSSRTFLFLARPDLGFPPASGYNLKMGFLGTTSVTPGHNEEFEKAVKEVAAIAGKSGLKAYLVGKVAFGGNSNDYITFAAFDNFADVQKTGPGFLKALADAKLPSQSGIVMWSENSVVSMVPELSIESAGQ
jgi:hypothetical protein